MPADFTKLMSARFLFTLAVQMQAVVLGWRMYAVTEDPLYLGLVGLAEAIPALSLALYAGYIVDRSRPLLIYRRLVYVSTLSGVVMLVSQAEMMGLSVQAQIWGLFASSLLTGTARAFSQPSIFSAVPKIVPRDQLAQASAWSTSTLQIGRISGPAVGGLLYGWLGMSGTAAIVCLVLSGAMAAMLLIQASPPPADNPRDSGSIRTELFLGARFVFSHPVLLPALSLDMVSVLFGGVTALLPIYATKILMTGPIGLGALRAAPAAGAALTSLWLTSKDIGEKAGSLLFMGVTGFGACVLVFAVSRNFWLSLAALALSGAFDSVSAIIRSAAVQLASPDDMRGRISSVNSMFIGSSNELGEFESGVAAKLMGVMPAAVFGGIVCLGTVAVVALAYPSLRRLDLNRLSPESA